MHVDDVRRIAVIGAGLMGHSMAQEFAMAGYDVCLTSRGEASLQKALANIEANLRRLVALGATDEATAAGALPRIRTTTSLEDAVRDADLALESVFEDVALKTEVFNRMDAASPPAAILASNTSTLRMSDFTGGMAHPERALMAHYFNPPHLVPLVEVAPSPQTAPEVVDTLCALLTRIGKRPVRLQREVPGFIANRLQAAMFREALALVDSGVASAAEVDTVIKSSIGRRWAVAGIFEVWELAGWDLIEAAAGGLLPDLDRRTTLSPLLAEMVARGELGVKSGKGFYEWSPDGVEVLKHRIARALVQIERFE